MPATPWMDRLIGMTLPRLRLLCSDGATIDLATFSKGPLIAYLYPGDGSQAGEPARLAATPRGRGSRRGGAPPAPTSCAVQRAGFRDYALDFAALGTRVIGISSESHDAQRAVALAEQLPFPLASDAECQVADALSLPTLTDLGVRRYRRVTLACVDGQIEAAFYPVSPKRSATQALSWAEQISRGPRP